MKAEAKSKAWAEKKAAGAASEDMPKDAGVKIMFADGINIAHGDLHDMKCTLSVKVKFERSMVS
eukprot:1387862-Amorphochlora_amoeboformis.AAC.3